MMIVGNVVMDWVSITEKTKVFKQVGKVKELVTEVSENGVVIKVHNNDKSIDYDYVGEVLMYVNNEYVSRETFVNGEVYFYLFNSDIGKYDIKFTSLGIGNCGVTYEKN